MARLLIHVEGQTEETFVNEVLAPHLYGHGYTRVGARLLGNARQRQRRGGVKNWPTVRSDIARHLREDAGALATTMVDYYGLPAAGDGAWPGRAVATTAPPADRARHVQDAIRTDLARAVGLAAAQRRFLPFLLVHEFEALLFSDCQGFARGIGMPRLAGEFQAIRDQFATPEEINDSPTTAPSKRVVALVPGYTKPLFGALAALEIGLETMRGQCPHLHAWLSALEAWP